ncbi:MAG: hypothetical protein KTU85_10895, partial [Acidimicrobiia bacterium]|nr:hypothetical protein [Acidimicrobiia bacterium]
MVLLDATDALNASGRGPDRWRLCRAGIVNVYQYENEVLHFAGGRLLLRGVNGSGKSTAMRIHALGPEATRCLQSPPPHRPRRVPARPPARRVQRTCVRSL